jgi:hypothetical protein
LQRFDQACNRFEAAWQRGERPRIEDHLAAVPEPERPLLLRELLALELAYCRQCHETVSLDHYRERFPEHAALVEAVVGQAGIQRERPPGEASSVQVSVDTGPEPTPPADPEQPGRLGCYWITTVLRKGGFGVVYRGHGDAGSIRARAVGVRSYRQAARWSSQSSRQSVAPLAA